ncbi:GGDEF domain-containing protein [Pseudodesulfovibrio cashew]|nr:GGDEF domain-containing protein [Pseudodesulfovibrio cashew]
MLLLGLGIVLFGSGLGLGVFVHERELVRELPADVPLFVMGLVLPAVILSAALFFTCTVRLRRELGNARKSVADLATLDELTGVPNRRHFFERFDEEVDRALRYGTRLSLIMVDIDHFSRTNAELGHPAGDLALAEVARLLAANIRTSDIIGRYGGEEFAILVPAQGLHTAAQVAEKLRVVIEINDLAMEGPRLKVTVSAGVAEFQKGEGSPEELRDRLIRDADTALARAKAGGRNRVATHGGNGQRQLRLI